MYDDEVGVGGYGFGYPLRFLVAWQNLAWNISLGSWGGVVFGAIVRGGDIIHGTVAGRTNHRCSTWFLTRFSSWL